MLRSGFVLGFAGLGSCVASAEVPAPALIGAERVTIACEFPADFSPAMQQGICKQLIQRAQDATNLPVGIAPPSDLSSDLRRLGAQRQELHLRVKISATDVEDGRKSLRLEITPLRPGRPINLGGPTAVTASIVRVQDDWVLMGPIAAFTAVLGSSGHRLHKPILAE